MRNKKERFVNFRVRSLLRKYFSRNFTLYTTFDYFESVICSNLYLDQAIILLLEHKRSDSTLVDVVGSPDKRSIKNLHVNSLLYQINDCLYYVREGH